MTTGAVVAPANKLPTEETVRLAQGTDNTLEFLVRDELGEPVNVTGQTVQFTAKDEENGTVQIASITATGVDEPNGKVSVTIARTAIDDEVSDDRPTYWRYEVRRTDGSGNQTVHIKGDIIIEPSVGTG